MTWLTAPDRPTSQRAHRARIALVGALVGAGLGSVGCATPRNSSLIVNQIRLHGVRSIDADALRTRIATQQSTLPTRPAVPLVSRFEYYDSTTFHRDIERIERAYAAEGYYGAAVEDVHVETDTQRRLVNVDITVREGERTTVGTLWLSGCEEGSELVLDHDACDEMRRRLTLQLGGAFTEGAFASDRELLRAMMEDQGRAAARVQSRATVDPEFHRAHVVFVLDPGPESFFGETQIVEGDGSRAIRNGNLPSGYPVAPVESALSIESGTAYSRSVIANAQRRVFELGAFGIVRIIPVPRVCRVGVTGCGAQPTSAVTRRPLERWVRVDLRVQLSPKAVFFHRFGIGAETDQLRSSARASWRFEWRNAFGGMRRLSGEIRPQLYFPSLLGNFAGSFAPGVAASIELRHPELFRRWSFAGGMQFDIGPDPFNPNRTSRIYGRPYAGLQFAFNQNGFGAIYLRGAGVSYYGQEAFFHTDPIYSAQYFNQTYYYLEATLGGDWRDNPLATHRGAYLRGTVHASGPVIPQVNPYAFVRGLLEGRAFIPITPKFTIATRISLGLGLGIGDAGAGGWPVPQELRFYSGGANSNRGYPFNRVGPLATVPRQTCVVTMADGTMRRTEDCNRPMVGGPLRVGTSDNPDDLQPTAKPDINRLLAVGGLGLWEFSLEARYFFGNFGIVGFVDLSNVSGWNVPTTEEIPRRTLEINSDITPPAVPPAGFSSFGNLVSRLFDDAHPSVGLGLRYVSPIGVIRLDAGVRVDDIGCSRFNTEIEQQRASAASSGQYPWYFVSTRPPCNLLGAAIPAEIAIAIGEAY
ncbi:MAG: BamA/TamA family outer membrane protein [Myxococcales bacterium]|nr:BamA/TamA family outer membrane protein [Myxococcales bacterium]